MKKLFSLGLMLFWVTQLQAQYKVTFILKENTTILHDSIFVTGSFSNWDSTANPAYLMKPHGEKEKIITLNLKPGTISYKFHRGSWFTVEKLFTGDEVGNRLITLAKDTILKDEVNAWRDDLLIDKWKSLSHQIPDTVRIKLLVSLANIYGFNFDYINTDSAFYYAQQAMQLVQKTKSVNAKGLANGNTEDLMQIQELTAQLLHSLGNYPRALELRLENLKLAEKNNNNKTRLVSVLGSIASDYLSMKDYRSMLNYAKQQDSILATLDGIMQTDPHAFFWSKFNVATALYKLNDLLPALAFAKQALSINNSDNIVLWIDNLYGRQLLANIYSALNVSDSAKENYRFIIANAPYWAGNHIALAQTGLAREFQKNGYIDSALFYARRALGYYQTDEKNTRAWGESPLYYTAELSPLLAELYKSNNQPDSAYKFLKLSIAIKDSLYNTERLRQFQTLGFNEANRRQQQEQQIREERQRYETKIKMYGLISIITGFIVLVFVLYRNNKQKQNANILLQSQKKEIETTLGELKSTQKQLIQSEKMASLGELTAGIAHEIQNPLNFVNNFSEINNELIKELKSEVIKGNIEEVNALADDIESNSEKINHHGKRADTIVKGMLQHSHTSSGQKELTDINTLCDEYLRLAYHGLRAKDKFFNAKFETDFDNTLQKINVMPQDIGRVILNLINNAFYAVSEKRKMKNEKYEPTVTVSTKKLNGKVEISVKDNGNGIPQKVLDKIFQPFFTTKPTGQGTGLGLSLSYDIIKAHGGEIKVETKENEGTMFSIILPS